MTDQNEFDDENLTEAEIEARKRKGKTGRGEDGGAGSGITTARFSAQGKTTVKPLSGAKKQEVMRAFEYLDVAKAMARVAEFFSELPARASANLKVDWSNIKGHGHAVVSHIISFGTEVSQLMRDRTAGAIKRLRTKYGIKVARPNTAAAPNTGPGMA